jgi:predicted alpha/beta superfamily hydrolase
MSMNLHRRRWLGQGLALGITAPLARAAAPVSGRDAGWEPVVLADTRQQDFLSSHTGHRHRIFLSVPDTPEPAAGHPVLYALDGNSAFPSLVQMNRTVARRREVTGLDPAIIVGIGYPTGADYDMRARSMDYTPPAPGAEAGTGGAERFLDFIVREVQPLVAATYPVNPARQALFGHSYGGLFALHCAFTRPGLFHTLIAASPSIWWAERFILGELDRLATSVVPRLLITVGEHEQRITAGERRDPPRAALLATRLMVDDARALAARLGADARWRGRVAYDELRGENHGSALYPSLVRGLDYFLGQTLS